MGSGVNILNNLSTSPLSHNFIDVFRIKRDSDASTGIFQLLVIHFN